MIIELGMESQSFYLGLIVLASFLFVIWFVAGRKGGYGPPTTLNLKKGESLHERKNRPVVQADVNPAHRDSTADVSKMRDVTPQAVPISSSESAANRQGPGIGTAGVGAKPPAPPGPPPQAIFIYNGHDWDAFEVLGVSPYSSFSEITRIYQSAIKKCDSGKHEFLQTAYMAILKLK